LFSVSAPMAGCPKSSDSAMVNRHSAGGQYFERISAVHGTGDGPLSNFLL
jgi:hypothetical protein